MTGATAGAGTDFLAVCGGPLSDGGCELFLLVDAAAAGGGREGGGGSSSSLSRMIMSSSTTAAVDGVADAADVRPPLPPDEALDEKFSEKEGKY